MHAIILAGGKGKRLYPLTQTVPKPMLPVRGKPILHHQIEMLHRRGVESITVVAGHQGEKVLDYFNRISFSSLRIKVLMEECPKGTAGATRMALEQMDACSEPILLTSGDSLFDFDLKKIVINHERSNAILTMILVPMHSPYGIVELDRGQGIVSFLEKPYLPYPMMSGIYVLSMEILRYLPLQGDMKVVLPALLAEKRVHPYLTSRYWKSVETAKDLEELDSDMLEERILQKATLCSPPLHYSDLKFEE